jgi:hypothetical protein
MVRSTEPIINFINLNARVKERVRKKVRGMGSSSFVYQPTIQDHILRGAGNRDSVVAERGPSAPWRFAQINVGDFWAHSQQPLHSSGLPTTGFRR